MARNADHVPLSFFAPKISARKLYLASLTSGLSQSEILRRILEAADLTKIETGTTP